MLISALPVLSPCLLQAYTSGDTSSQPTNIYGAGQNSNV